MVSDADSIKVKDNRLFNTDGSLREPLREEDPKPAPKISTQTTPQAVPKPEPKIDFQTFMLSLASSAQISMGIVPNPITGRTSRDLAHAKQTLDILGLLEQKTKNNLTPEESGLLKNILFQLRMQFVELAKHEKQVS